MQDSYHWTHFWGLSQGFFEKIWCPGRYICRAPECWRSTDWADGTWRGASEDSLKRDLHEGYLGERQFLRVLAPAPALLKGVGFLGASRPPQKRAIARWDIIHTGTCGLTTVATYLALHLHQPQNTLRQRLREFYKDAAHKTGNRRRELNITPCFAALMRWVLRLWTPQPKCLALALDATTLQQRFTVLSISVLYHGRALPVAWKIVPATQKGWEALLEALRETIPAEWTVLVCADRGLYAPWLFARIVQMGWHPFLRINAQGLYRVVGETTYRSLATVVPQAGTQWRGRVVCFKDSPLECTLLACWDAGQSEAWLIVTDLPPEVACVWWYGMRAWIESGISDLKRRGWQWHRTQVRDAARAERLWLALAVATVWVVSVGSEAARRREASGLGGCVGVSCFRLGRLQVLVWLAEGDEGFLGRLYGEDWLGARSPPA